jgi:uncharacterized protein YdbL (DUF1318 family)
LSRRHAIQVVLALLCALLLPAAALAEADALDTAKANGQVGERSDGYVGVVRPETAPQSIHELVQRINEERTERYMEIARKNGIPITEVAALAGRKLLERAEPGEMVMNARGDWVEKGS